MARKLLACAVLAVLMLSFASPVLPQTGENPCDTDALRFFSDYPEYASACAAMNVCLELANGEIRQCMPHFLIERLHLCASDDAVCITQAQLQTALASMPVWYDLNMYNQPEEHWREIAGILLDAENLQGDPSDVWYPIEVMETDGAFGKRMYLQFNTSDPMVEYSLGVLQALMGNQTAALEFFNTSISLDTTNPLAYWSRGNLFAAQGEDERAALDYLLFAVYTAAVDQNPALAEMIDDLAAQYPVPLDDGDPFLEYPTVSVSEGVGGSFHRDLSLEKGHPVWLLSFADHLLYYTLSDDALSDSRQYELVSELYALEPKDDGSYVVEAGYYYLDYERAMYLIPTDEENVFEIRLGSLGFESSGGAVPLLAPADHPDPRDTSGFRCPDSVLSRLTVGDVAELASYFGTLQVHAAPNSEEFTAIETVYPPPQVYIVSGPVCQDGGTWWEVSVNEITGWVNEADSEDPTLYALNPA